MENIQQTWLITGGAHGIGKCLVEFLCGLKQKVVFVDKDAVSAQKMIEVMRHQDLHFIACDLASEKDLDDMINQARNIYPAYDCIIHNAATARGGLSDASYDDFLQTLKVNLVAPFYITKQLISHLSSYASIVHILSTRAFQSQAQTESYSASKGGLFALTHALAASLKGIARVNAISPGWIDTNTCEKRSHSHTPSDHKQHLSETIGAPMDVIRAILFLTNPQNHFINATHLVIDGGMSKQMIYHQEGGWTFEPLNPKENT